MLRPTGRWLRVLGVMVIPLACTALPQAGTPGEGGTLAVQDLPTTDAVPLAWGSLVAVTPSPPNASALWFRDDSGTVRMVGLDHQTRKLWPTAQLIRRE